MKSSDLLELLSVDLLEKQAEIIDSMRIRADEFGIQLGWHYDLDLAWIVSHLGDPTGMRILDAGGGTGILQWWLADHGADVVSVDRLDRSDLSGRFRLSYRVAGLRSGDFDSAWGVALRRLTASDRPIGFRLGGAMRAIALGVASPFVPKSPGRLTIYRHRLDSLPDLPDESFDAVVSVSALEHNDPSSLPAIVDELMRVLRPGSLLLATVSASRDDDWLHEPSQGWCLTESSLWQSFRIPQHSTSNFTEYDSVFAEIRGSEILQDHLAPEYSQSGEGGMPWGIWDPKYVPVGIRKKKPYV